MASIRDCAKEIYDIAVKGIEWILIWKTGRSWHTEVLSSDVDFDRKRIIIKEYEEEYDRILAILIEDNDAILVNGYYTNLGVSEDYNDQNSISGLADALKWQYEECHSQLRDYDIIK